MPRKRTPFQPRDNFRAIDRSPQGALTIVYRALQRAGKALPIVGRFIEPDTTPRYGDRFALTQTVVTARHRTIHRGTVLVFIETMQSGEWLMAPRAFTGVVVHPDLLERVEC